MIESIKEAITDRIKTPIIGTFFLFLAWFNYLQLHSLLINFNDIKATKIAYESISFNWCWPSLLTIGSVLLMTAIKIFNQNWDIITTRVSDSLKDKLSPFHFRENLREIERLRLINMRLANGIIKAKASNNKVRIKLGTVTERLRETKAESTRYSNDTNSTSDLQINSKRTALADIKGAVNLSKDIDTNLNGV